MNKPSDAGQRFHYLLALPLVTTAVASFLVYSACMIVRYPDVFSPNGILLLVLNLAVGVFAWRSAILLWWANYIFDLTPSSLVATHLLTRHQIRVSWDSIVRARKK